MGSSLANAIKRRTHKERAQPAARKKYGLLEKHKDYVKRARNFHKKEKTIKKLQEKAEQRNPDEFYFAMENARTKDGVHIARSTEANKYSQEELRLMRTQDVKYLHLKAQVDAKKAERLRSSLHFIGAAQQSKHTVYVDSAAEAKTFKASEYFNTPAELLDRSFNRPRREQLQSAAAVKGAAAASSSKLERQKYAAYKQLAQRQERRDKVAAVAARVEQQQLLQGKGHKRKLAAAEAGQPPVFRWKRERQR